MGRTRDRLPRGRSRPLRRGDRRRDLHDLDQPVHLPGTQHRRPSAARPASRAGDAPPQRRLRTAGRLRLRGAVSAPPLLTARRSGTGAADPAAPDTDQQAISGRAADPARSTGWEPAPSGPAPAPSGPEPWPPGRRDGAPGAGRDAPDAWRDGAGPCDAAPLAERHTALPAAGPGRPSASALEAGLAAAGCRTRRAAPKRSRSITVASV